MSTMSGFGRFLVLDTVGCRSNLPGFSKQGFWRRHPAAFAITNATREYWRAGVTELTVACRKGIASLACAFS